MPRPRNIIPPTQLCFHLPLDIRAQLDLLLFSKLEGRVPHGAYQEFFAARIREYLESESLDLAPFLPNTDPGFAIVRGRKEVVTKLRRILES